MNTKQHYQAIRQRAMNHPEWFRYRERDYEQALRDYREAQTRASWDSLNGYVLGYDYEPEPDEAPVRLRLEPDCDADPCDFDGTERQLEAARERANRDGMWGMIGEYWDGHEWIEVDAVWGFIGDDWENSGYDTNIMTTTIEHYQRHETEQTINVGFQAMTIH